MCWGICCDNGTTTLGLRDCNALLDLVCACNDLTDLRTIGCNSLYMIACQWNY